MAYTADHAYELIESAHQRGRLAHAFLLSGAAGSGKRALAARIIHLLNGGGGGGGGMDLFGEPVVEVVPALEDLVGEWVRLVEPQSKSRRIRIDEIRELERPLYSMAPAGKWKVAVIAEADRLMDQAANAFLKTLEEPPPQCLLLLLTDNPRRLLPTILSRCVNLPLHSPGARAIDAAQETMARKLTEVADRHFGQVIGAMTIKAAFTNALADCKEAITKAGELAQKEEINHYKQSTDGEWLKGREEHYKALIESEYLEERNRLLEVLSLWLADVIRQKVGATGLDFPEHAEVSAEIAQQTDIDDLLRRLDAIHEMSRILETNAMEALALDVGFLRAFG